MALVEEVVSRSNPIDSIYQKDTRYIIQCQKITKSLDLTESLRGGTGGGTLTADESIFCIWILRNWEKITDSFKNPMLQQRGMSDKIVFYLIICQKGKDDFCYRLNVKPKKPCILFCTKM